MKVDRLVSIIMILLEKQRMGAQELATMFEVSPRTIYRDIDAINMAGIPIRAIPGVGGGFESMQSYKVNNKVFSLNDLSSILLGLSSISSMVSGEELVNAIAKVKSFIPADQAKKIELKTNQLYIDLNAWMGNRYIQKYIELLKVAMEESRLVSFEYSDHRGNKTSREVEPYQLIMKSSYWYFYGYCLKRNDFRLFKLARIYDLKVQEERFSLREYHTPKLDYSEYDESLQSEILIRIHQSVMDRVLDFCPYENFSVDGEEYYIVRFPFIENDFYYNILFSLGDKCECIEPLHIREEMRRRILAMAKTYSKKERP